jgi:hypothetical protein
MEQLENLEVLVLDALRKKRIPPTFLFQKLWK